VQLQKYDKEHIPDLALKAVKPIVADPDFNGPNIATKSAAAAGMSLCFSFSLSLSFDSSECGLLMRSGRSVRVGSQRGDLLRGQSHFSRVALVPNHVLTCASITTDLLLRAAQA
jgi:hypothetical protein